MALELEDEAPSAASDKVKTTKIVGRLNDSTGVLIVDTSNIAYRACYGNPDLKTSRGEFTGHVFGALRSLLAVLQNHLDEGAWLPIFCYDGSHSKDERRQILPSYKANRDPNRFNPIPAVEMAFRMMPGLNVKHPQREGDDAIAWVVEKLNRGKRQAVVYSGDKDVWTLMKHPGVRVFSPNLERFVTAEDVLKEFHTTPERIPLAKAFHGDPSDGVKGVERLVRKVMAPHINDAMEISVSQVYGRVRAAGEDSADLTPKERAKAAKLLAKVEPEFKRVCDNFRVVTANTTGFTAEHVRSGEQNKPRLAGALEYMECRSLLSRIDDFFGAEMWLQHDG